MNSVSSFKCTTTTRTHVKGRTPCPAIKALAKNTAPLNTGQTKQPDKVNTVATAAPIVTRQIFVYEKEKAGKRETEKDLLWTIKHGDIPIMAIIACTATQALHEVSKERCNGAARFAIAILHAQYVLPKPVVR